MELVVREFAECTNQVDLVIAIMHTYGLRANEALTLRYERIIDDTVIFAGLKGSRDRYVRSEQLVSAIHRICGARESGRVFTTSYGQLYNYLRSFDFGINGVKKARITSAFRLLLVNKLKREGYSADEIKEEIGHKRKETTIYYLKTVENWGEYGT